MSFQIIYLGFFVIGLFFFARCKSETIEKGFQLEGTWKEVKGNSVFDKSRREVLYQIERIGDVYTGRIISLDNALGEKNQIRSCRNCSEKKEMLLGLSLLRGVKKKENGIYYGEFYDVYNRKWFSIKITPISGKTINIRTYAVFPLFGRNILWERGEEYQKKILESPPVQLQENKQYYALEIGNIDYQSENLIHIVNLRKKVLPSKALVYFFSKQGEMLTHGSIINANELEILVELKEKKEIGQAIPILFFDRTIDWSGKD